MITGDQRIRFKGRVVQIISPEKQDNFIIQGIDRDSIKGKYIVVMEDEAVPRRGFFKGFFKRLIYGFKNRKSEKRLALSVIMSACHYFVGEVVEVTATEIMEPTGFFTTEV